MLRIYAPAPGEAKLDPLSVGNVLESAQSLAQRHGFVERTDTRPSDLPPPTMDHPFPFLPLFLSDRYGFQSWLVLSVYVRVDEKELLVTLIDHERGEASELERSLFRELKQVAEQEFGADNVVASETRKVRMFAP